MMTQPRPASKKILTSPAQTPQPSQAKVQTITVAEDYSEQRLDNFLMRELKGVPRSHVHQLIRTGQVRVNAKRADSERRLQAGDVVRIPPVRMKTQANQLGQQASAKRLPSSLPKLPVLFEDEHLLAIHKPAGVAVHGGSGVSLGVIEQLRLSLQPTPRFLELVHRLDRDTSGVLLLAKKRSALTRLHQAWRERQPEKIYLAVVQGQWQSGAKIDLALSRYVSGDGERRVRVDEQGQSARTYVQVAETFQLDGQHYSLLRLRITTGRTHQIRVHLSHLGHPILGDDKYGDFALNRALARGSFLAEQSFSRMFLHAWQLNIAHPANPQSDEQAPPLRLQAPLPHDFQALLLALRKP